MAHDKTSLFKLGKGKKLVKTGPKFIRANINPHSSMPSIHENMWQDVNTKEFGWLCPYGTVCGGSSLGLALLISYSLLNSLQLSSEDLILGFSLLLGSPLHFQLHSHSFTRYPLRSTLPDLTKFSEIRKSSQPHNAFILHASKASTMCMMLKLLVAGAETRFPSFLPCAPSVWIAKY